MNILGKIFSSGATDLVKGVGGVIDNLHTSKEEKLEAEKKIKDIAEEMGGNQVDRILAYVSKEHKDDDDDDIEYDDDD